MALIRLSPVSSKPLFPKNRQRNRSTFDIGERETVVEETDERTDGAGPVIVLRLAEKQRRTSFDITEIDVVAERRATNLAARIDGQNHFRLGIVPA